MSFDWSEYLSLAKELAGLPGPQCDIEADYRAAISRAYYAAYHKAIEFLRDKAHESFPEGPNSHARLIERFSTDPLRERKSIGLDLQRIKDARVKADYYTAFRGPRNSSIHNEAILAVQRADNLIEKLKRIS